MYDDDIFNMLNSYSQTTTDSDVDTEDESSNVNQQSNTLNSQQNFFDDYSTAQNYQSEQNYQSQQTYNTDNYTSENDNNVEKIVHTLELPVVAKTQQPVSLIKTKRKVYLSGRLKLALAVFSIIFLSFAFISVWNIAKVNSLNNSFVAKENQINEISQSINELSNSYSELVEFNLSPENLDGYAPRVEGENTFVISLDNFYKEAEVEKISSNWFNDVCEFFSKLFA